MRYRKLRVYKYQLTSIYKTKIKIVDIHIKTPYIKLTPDGELTIYRSYAWDGPSGPTIDTKNFMRASLIHDVLYQLIRMKLLRYKYKKYADCQLRKDCIKDGMSKFRAWYIYQAVKWFGASSAKAKKSKIEILYAP